MTWSLASHQPKRDDREPRLELLRVYWRVVGPSKIPVQCALYRTNAGLEVRVDRSAEDLLRSQVVTDEAAGESCAAEWRAAIDRLWGFVDVPLDS